MYFLGFRNEDVYIVYKKSYVFKKLFSSENEITEEKKNVILAIFYSMHLGRILKWRT